MRWLTTFLLEHRVNRLVRDLLQHAEACCVGVPDHCDRWAAISEQYDDALARLRAARERTP